MQAPQYNIQERAYLALKGGYYILETFPILWLYQQSIKYLAIYEEKINCVTLR